MKDLDALTALLGRHPAVHTNGQWAPIEYCGCNRWDSDGPADRHRDHLARILKRWLASHDRQVRAEAWELGVATALNHAVRQDDGITLKLEHLDGTPWQNPFGDG